MLVAVTALASLKQEKLFGISRHIDYDLVGFSLFNNRTSRKLKNYIITVFATTILLASFFAVACLILAHVTIVRQSIDTVIHLKDHAAAVTPVTPVGSAVGHIFLSSE